MAGNAKPALDLDVLVRHAEARAARNNAIDSFRVALRAYMRAKKPALRKFREYEATMRLRRETEMALSVAEAELDRALAGSKQ